jgi:hypothetical protein
MVNMGTIVEAVGTIVAEKDGEKQRELQAALVRGIEKAIEAGVSLSNRQKIRFYQQQELEKLKE